jgi:hypothetical protein
VKVVTVSAIERNTDARFTTSEGVAPRIETKFAF